MNNLEKLLNTSIDTGILKTNLKKFAKELLLKAHPINSYFITESNDNPSDLSIAP